MNMADDTLAKIKSTFEGKWALDKSEQFEEFLKVMGWNEDRIKNASDLQPVHEVKVTDGKVNIIITAGSAVRDELFTLGQEYEMEDEGEKNKFTTTFEDNKLVTVTPNTKLPKMYRHVTDGSMVFELHIKDVVCKRFFKKC